MASKRVEIRVPEPKRRVWQAAAERNRLTLSGFVKKSCDTAANGAPFLTPPEIEALHQLSDQLRRAGVNLNTLLRELQAVATGRHRDAPTHHDFAQVRDELQHALASVRAFLQTKV